MSTGQILDPHGNQRFLVEIDGIARASFHEVQGVETEIEVTEHREGGWNPTPHKLPGMTKHPNIVLKWGLAYDRDIVDWHQRIAQGNVERKNGAIVLLNRLGEEAARWNFVRAWPTKYTAPSFAAEGNDIAIETMELAHEGLARES
jgi:phage tail-like protein